KATLAAGTAESESKIESLQGELETTKKSREALETSSTEQLQEVKAKHEQEVNGLNEDLKQSKASSAADLASLRIELESVNGANVSLNEKYETAVAKFEQELTEAKADKETTVEGLKSEINELSNKEASDKAAAGEAAQQELDKLKIKREEDMSRVVKHEQTIADNNEKFKELQAKLEKLEVSKDEASRRERTASLEMGRRVKEAEDEMDKYHKEIDKLTKMKMKSCDEKIKLREQYEEKLKKQSSVYESQIEDMELNLEETKNSLALAETNLKMLKRDIKRREAKEKDMKISLEDTDKVWKYGEKDKFQEERAENKKALEEAKKKHESKEKEISDMESRLNEQQKRAEKYRDKYEKLLEDNKLDLSLLKDIGKTVNKTYQKVEEVQEEQKIMHETVNKTQQKVEEVREEQKLMHERIKAIDEGVRNNLVRFTNLLNKEVEVPNLIIVLPKPEQTSTTAGGSWSFGKSKSGERLGKLAPRSWFTTATLELHIICPIKKKTAVKFDIPEATEFVKNNAGLIKVGIAALKVATTGVKLAAKVGLGVTMTEFLEIPDVTEYIGGLDDCLATLGLDNGEVRNESDLITNYMEEKEKGKEIEEKAKKITGEAYEKLKEFLMAENRMEVVRRKMELITGKDEEKMWVERKNREIVKERRKTVKPPRPPGAPPGVKAAGLGVGGVGG
ncbi:hypothetical protein TrVE_jg12799, partial [Triparma verrucosa]